MKKTYQLTRLESLNKDLSVVELYPYDKGQPYCFEAGQMIDIFMKTGEYYPVFIVNSYHESGKIMAFLHQQDDKKLLEFLQNRRKTSNNLKMPVDITLRGPKGRSPLSGFLGDKPVIMVINGPQHIAPVMAMLETLSAKQDDRKWHLFWGGRNLESLFLDDKIRAFAKKHRFFNYTPVVVEKDDQYQDILQGLVHQQVIKHYPNLTDFVIYLNGSVAFAHAARSMYMQHGAHPLSIMSEQFSQDYSVTTSPPQDELLDG
jgi:NAD(P)H-flavin reductase